MKCGACGFEKIGRVYEDKLYVRGPKKGQVKETNYVDKDPGEREFIKLEGEFKIDDWNSIHRVSRVREIYTLYACPKCGTLQLQEGDR